VLGLRTGGRLQSPTGYLRSGVTATLADQLGSAVFFSSGLTTSGVSLEINLSFVDTAAVGVRLTFPFSPFTIPLYLIMVSGNFEFAMKLELFLCLVLKLASGQFRP
jgi:hypothetical protein